MKEQIIEYVTAHPGTSFAELIRVVPGFKGELALCMTSYPNLVLWSSLSQAAVDALTALMREKKIKINSTSPMVYMVDGLTLRMPVAKRVFNYKRPHWLPVTFFAGDYKEPGCGICKKPGGEYTVRKSWTQAGGAGLAPPAAWVHPRCDQGEQAKLKSGRLLLTQLWRKRDAVKSEAAKPH